MDKSIQWEIKVYRYQALMNLEQIVILQSSGMNTIMANDNSLRGRSYMQSSKTEVNYTSWMRFDLKRSSSQLGIYVRNIQPAPHPQVGLAKTFKIVLQKSTRSMGFAQIMYSILSSLCCCMMCMLCMVSICRCLSGRNPESLGGVDYMVDNVNP